MNAFQLWARRRRLRYETRRRRWRRDHPNADPKALEAQYGRRDDRPLSAEEIKGKAFIVGEKAP